MNNPVKTEVERQLSSQLAKGEHKYGHGIILDGKHDWLQEAIEECVDQLQYLCAAKLEHDKLPLIKYTLHSDGSSTSEPTGEYLSNYIDTNGKLKFTIDDTRPPKSHELHGLD